MTTVNRVAPIFAVRDLDAAMAYYRQLGFETRAYDGGYAFAIRDRVEIHLGLVPDGGRQLGSAYLFVDDAHELFHEWQAAGVDVRPPEETEWHMHEGAVIDPDGNVIRFGSPSKAPDGHAHPHD